MLSSADDDCEVDQLLLVSSPNTELSSANLVKEIEDSKLGMMCHWQTPFGSFLLFSLFLARGDPDA